MVSGSHFEKSSIFHINHIRTSKIYTYSINKTKQHKLFIRSCDELVEININKQALFFWKQFKCDFGDALSSRAN